MSIGRWFRDHPNLLSRGFRSTQWIFKQLDPLISRLGYTRIDALLRVPEELSKKIIFDCRMCGQCVLHATGMTCPMTCPKNLRNGPCGGVRQNDHCEVFPEMRCVWVEAYERSQKMVIYGDEIHTLQPPVNRELEDTSAWVNMLSGADLKTPKGWDDG